MLIGREAGQGIRKYHVRYFWEVKCEACWELMKERGHSFLNMEAGPDPGDEENRGFRKGEEKGRFIYHQSFKFSCCLGGGEGLRGLQASLREVCERDRTLRQLGQD
jgi:hypothetical protein